MEQLPLQGRNWMELSKLIKGARLVIVPDGPHRITWTDAEQANLELVNFLGQKLGVRAAVA